MTPKDVVMLHARLWEQKYGERYYVSWKKETIQAARLLKLYGADKLSAYLRHYHTDYRSNFADRAGRSFGAFISELPAVIASYTSEQSKRDVTRETDFERLRIARGDE